MWKLHLPIGDKDPKFGKWSPNWLGPFIVHGTQPNEPYLFKDLDGELHERLINGKIFETLCPILVGY